MHRVLLSLLLCTLLLTVSAVKPSKGSSQDGDRGSLVELVSHVLVRLDELQVSINELKNCSCRSDVADLDDNPVYVSAGCATPQTLLITSGVYSLDASQPGSWPTDGFCRIAVQQGAPENKDYTIGADLLNVNGWLGVASGHLGLFFNMQDMNNFDVVYFRVHTSSPCYQTGRVVNGVFTGVATSACANGYPPAGQWFSVSVTVSGGSATVYKDGVSIVTMTPFFQRRSSGGVLMANGYSNTGQFMNLVIN